MLHGIGGRTITEAKQNISHDEFAAWIDYIKKRGNLDLGLRVEYGFGLIAYLLNRVNGGKADLADYLIHWDRKQPEIDDVMILLKKGRQ